MIKETEKGRVVAITSYCDTEEKLNVLIVNISLLRSLFPDYKIALHANYPLSPKIQESVDMYLYEDLNHVDENKYTYYWNRITDGEPYFDKVFYYSIADAGYSVFQQIRALTEYLIDYDWVMLINYDTAVDEIRPDDYSTKHDLTVHWFPGHTAYSLIMMFFNPKKFIEVTSQFNFENWSAEKRINQLNEERFHDIIKETPGITVLPHDYKVPDRISGEPDYLKPNAPPNPHFTNYLLYQNENVLEIYLWGLLTPINTINAVDDSGGVYEITNQNNRGAFERGVKTYEWDVNSLHLKKINGNPVDIVLKIKKGYITRPI